MRILNHRKIARPNGGGEWARDALIRASKRLVRDGLADGKILQRSPRRSENEDLVTLVAALSRSPETRTLEAIAKALTEMHQPTPRGRLKWHVSSVKNLLDQARELGLVAETGQRQLLLCQISGLASYGKRGSVMGRTVQLAVDVNGLYAPPGPKRALLIKGS